MYYVGKKHETIYRELSLVNSIKKFTLKKRKKVNNYRHIKRWDKKSNKPNSVNVKVD